jgi:hypothetical protein
VSLSQDPALSALKEYFACGYRDITREPYAGVSGVHEVGGNAVDTSNGAGPHNLQLFMLSADGTVLNCLPGYWHSQDLIPEMQLAAQLNEVWLNPELSRAQKDQLFTQMHLAHISQHSPQMVRRSRMQSFDMKYEAEHRLNRSDTIANKGPVQMAVLTRGKMPPEAFKTTDEIFHERMARRPFLAYNQFDVAAYADYGKPKYDKKEDYRTADGQVNRLAARNAPEMGNPAADQQSRPMRRGRRGMASMLLNTASSTLGWGNGPKWGNNGN